MPDQPHPDNELTLRFMNGDDAVIRSILSQYGRPIIKLLLQRFRLLARLDAEGIFVEAVRKAWEARSRYDDNQAGLREWICAIALNLAKDFFRSGRGKVLQLEREFGHQHDSPQTERLRSDDIAPSIGADRERLLRDVASCFKSLSADQQAVLEADRDAEGPNASDVLLAELLDVSAVNVRVIRSRGKTKLRDCLRGRGHAFP